LSIGQEDNGETSFGKVEIAKPSNGEFTLEEILSGSPRSEEYYRYMERCVARAGIGLGVPINVATGKPGQTGVRLHRIAVYDMFETLTRIMPPDAPCFNNKHTHPTK
jgi:hypothetical protein